MSFVLLIFVYTFKINVFIHLSSFTQLPVIESLQKSFLLFLVMQWDCSGISAQPSKSGPKKIKKTMRVCYSSAGEAINQRRWGERDRGRRRPLEIDPDTLERLVYWEAEDGLKAERELWVWKRLLCWHHPAALYIQSAARTQEETFFFLQQWSHEGSSSRSSGHESRGQAAGLWSGHRTSASLTGKYIYI